MKTLFTSLGNNTLRSLLAGLSLAAALLVSETSSGQIIGFTDHKPLHTQVTDGLKVAVFPVYNSLLMRVLFENPNREKITLIIKNSKEELVYKKEIGRTTLYNSKFDVSQIKDGTYTMVIESKNQCYATSFFIETQQERMARAL